MKHFNVLFLDILLIYIHKIQRILTSSQIREEQRDIYAPFFILFVL